MTHCFSRNRFSEHVLCKWKQSGERKSSWKQISFWLREQNPGTEIWGTKVCEIENLILKRLYFSAKGTKTGKLCVKATWEVINPIKCYEHEHPSPFTIWLRHWVQGTSNEISVETEYCTHSKLQQVSFSRGRKKNHIWTNIPVAITVFS